MRTLTFEQFGESQGKVAEMLWAAFRVSYPRKAKGYEQIKLCNRIGEKIEAVTVPDPKDGDDANRTLRVGADRLVLEDAEHAKLVSMVKDEDIQWTFKSGPIVEQLIAGLDHASNGATHA